MDVIYGTEVKTIPRFPDYAISTTGRIWSQSRRLSDGRWWTGRWLSPYKNKETGYWYIWLRKGGKRFRYCVHTLVLETYIGPCPPGKQCRHLDGNTNNNCLCNLLWGTTQENVNDRLRHGNTVRGESCGRSKLTTREVWLIRTIYDTGKYTQAEIAEKFGVSQPSIHNIINKVTWK